jgi:hypothetical protein
MPQCLPQSTIKNEICLGNHTMRFQMCLCQCQVKTSCHSKELKATVTLACLLWIILSPTTLCWEGCPVICRNFSRMIDWTVIFVAKSFLLPYLYQSKMSLNIPDCSLGSKITSNWKPLLYTVKNLGHRFLETLKKDLYMKGGLHMKHSPSEDTIHICCEWIVSAMQCYNIEGAKHMIVWFNFLFTWIF